MQKVEIKKDWIVRAKDRASLSNEERAKIQEFLQAQPTTLYSYDLNFADLPDMVWRAMLDDAKLPAKIRSALALHVFGMKQSDLDLGTVYESEVENPVEFGTSLQLIVGRTPNAELFLNGRWYPVLLTVQFLEDEFKLTRGVQVSTSLRLGEHVFLMTHFVGRSLFLNEALEVRTRTVLEVLRNFGFRALQTSPSEFNLRLIKAERAAATPGELVMVSGSVILPSKHLWWQQFEMQSLGTEEMPSRCVVEPALQF